MYRLAYDDSLTHDEQVKMFGGYNSYPPNLKPISKDEFLKQLARGHFDRVDHKQVSRDYDGNEIPFHIYSGEEVVKTETIRECVLFIRHDNSGILQAAYTVRDYSGGYGVAQEVYEYYTFAVCEHKLRGVGAKEAEERGLPRPAHCFNVYYCDKCGYSVAYDSSD